MCVYKDNCSVIVCVSIRCSVCFNWVVFDSVCFYSVQCVIVCFSIGFDTTVFLLILGCV